MIKDEYKGEGFFVFFFMICVDYVFGVYLGNLMLLFKM